MTIYLLGQDYHNEVLIYQSRTYPISDNNFADLLEIETDLTEIETALSEIKTALLEIGTALLKIEIVYEFRLQAVRSRMCGRAVRISSRSVSSLGRSVKCLYKFVKSNGQNWVGLALFYHYLSMIILPK